MSLTRPFKGPVRRLFALLALGCSAGAAGVVLFVASAGAGEEPASTAGVSATAVAAQSLSAVPKSIDMASVPQQVTSGAVGAAPQQGAPQAKPFLSPLGAAALKQAKQVSVAGGAPYADEILPNPTGPSTPTGGSTLAGPSTPGGALAGWNGMVNGAATCPYFNGCQPPDHGIAASDSFVVQVVNASIAVYNNAGTLQAGFPKSLETAFSVPAPSPAGCDAAHANHPFLTDPRTFFDPVTGRFVVAFLQVEHAFGLSPGCTFVSRYWVAVSKTGNPTGAWSVYAFNTANLVGAGNSAADYTQLGFNSQAIFIGGNQFNQAGTAFNGAWTLAIPKATAEAGGAIGAISGFAGYTASDGSATRLLDTVQPVASYGDGAGGPASEFLIGSFNESVTESKAVVFAFSNPLSHQGHGQTLSGVVIPTLAYSQPPQADNYPACVNCLETIDNRISATPVYMHGNIYAVHDTAVNNGTATNANTHWMIVEPVLNQNAVAGCTECGVIGTQTHLVDNGRLTYGGTTDDWFGVIQPDREGNLFMAFEYGSTSGHVSPSSVYIARRATAAGGASWGDGGVFLRSAANATTNTRWGDYEATSFAGWNSNNIYFATEFAGPGGDWATHIDRVNYSNLTQK
jgi:hypothetical protein